jgi:hypothetical protein
MSDAKPHPCDCNNPRDPTILVERRRNPPKASTKDRRTKYIERAGSLLRVAMGGYSILTWFIAMTDPRAQMYWVATESDGAVALWMLMICGACVLIDAVVNDILPDRYHWRFALHLRHYSLWGMAAGFLAQVYNAYASNNNSGFTYIYLWNAGLILIAAFWDAKQRLKDAKCQIANNY